MLNCCVIQEGHGRAMTFSHATPLLIKLHWLPIAVRALFKILLMEQKLCLVVLLSTSNREKADAIRFEGCTPVNTFNSVTHEQEVSLWAHPATPMKTAAFTLDTHLFSGTF